MDEEKALGVAISMAKKETRNAEQDGNQSLAEYWFAVLVKLVDIKRKLFPADGQPAG